MTTPIIMMTMLTRTTAIELGLSDKDNYVLIHACSSIG